VEIVFSLVIDRPVYAIMNINGDLNEANANKECELTGDIIKFMKHKIEQFKVEKLISLQKTSEWSILQ
jgi:hypothetical protein